MYVSTNDSMISLRSSRINTLFFFFFYNTVYTVHCISCYTSIMPPPKGILWKYFLAGEKQNSSHIRAHCCDCIEKICPLGGSIELDDVGNPKLSKWLPRSLELLFAGRKESDVDEQLRRTRQRQGSRGTLRKHS
jgi:hypothetical protein